MTASMQSTNVYDIYLMLYVQSWTPDDGRKDRPKHVQWYSINRKIVHLAGFTTCFSFLCFSCTRCINWTHDREVFLPCASACSTSETTRMVSIIFSVSGVYWEILNEFECFSISIHYNPYLTFSSVLIFVFLRRYISHACQARSVEGIINGIVTKYSSNCLQEEEV
jgi:hypothetical protein